MKPVSYRFSNIVTLSLFAVLVSGCSWTVKDDQSLDYTQSTAYEIDEQGTAGIVDAAPKFKQDIKQDIKLEKRSFYTNDSSIDGVDLIDFKWNKIGNFEGFVSNRGSVSLRSPVPKKPSYDGMASQYPDVLVYSLDNSDEPYTQQPLAEDGMLYVISSEGVSVHGNEQSNGIHMKPSMAMGGMKSGYAKSMHNRKPSHVFYFKYGSDQLTMKDKEMLRQLARSTQENSYIMIKGHASKEVKGINDSNKQKDINWMMAMKRAVAVSHELFKADVDPKKVKVVSYGDARPNTNKGSMSQEVADRRAEVFVKTHTKRY